MTAQRILDLAIALPLLLVLSPTLLLIAVIILLDSGPPVLFRQTRLGHRMRPFTLLKFRTMIHDAEGQTGAVWATRHDARRTRIGAVLRRWSLDELPQLINVLRGDMALVGPRPERPEFVQQFCADLGPIWLTRHDVRPGITGWAQVNGARGQTSPAARLALDLEYLRRRSLWFDLWILWLTPFRYTLNAH